MLEYRIVDELVWEHLPSPQPKKTLEKYEEVLDQLEAHEIVGVQAKSENDLKGIRIAIGRKARARGFVTEFRSEGTMLYAKRSDQPIEPTDPKPRVHQEPVSADAKPGGV